MRRWITALAFPLGFALVAALGAVVGPTLLAEPEVSQSEQGERADAIRRDVRDSPAYVLNEHLGQCWTKDEKPLAVLPDAAIVQFTLPPHVGRTIYTDAHVDVDEAFSDVLHDLGFNEEPKSKRFDVIALCTKELR